MGLLDAITGTVVMRYKADTEQAKAAVRELSGAQKKAAQEQVAALEGQAKASEEMFAKYAKGAAIVGGAYALARTGLEALKTESRLAAGSTGVDLGRLSDAFDGLRSRTELMTLAQAGSRGAWNLTTGQIELVAEGMRALEAKGYDAQKVFERFTDVLHKGKTEGLDDFGLSLEATGDKAQDLQNLMRALGDQVVDVGGSFGKAGDAATRAMGRLENALTRIRTLLGKATEGLLDLAAAAGTGLGRAIFGDLETAGNNELRARDYRAALGAARYGSGFELSFTPADVTQGLETGVSRLMQGRIGTIGLTRGRTQEQEAGLDRDAAAIDAFRRNLRRLRDPVALEAAIAKLPKDYAAADPYIEDLIRRHREEVNEAAKEVAGGVFTAIKQKVLVEKERIASGSRSKGKKEDSDWWSNRLGALRDLALDAGRELTSQENNRRAGERTMAAADAAGLAATLNDAKSAAAELQAAFAAAIAETQARDSWLASMFGELWELDAYRESLTFLGHTAQSVSGQIYAAWAGNEEVTIKAVRRMLASEIAAEGQRLWARGLSGVLTGGLNLALGNPAGGAQIKAGLAAMAGGVAIGGLARAMSPGASGPTQTGRGSSAGAPAGGNAAPQRNTNVVVIGDAFSEQSPRQRARNVDRALRNSSVYYPAPQGAAP